MSQEAKILIVDDESCVRQLLTQILTQEGYECLTAADGNEALNKLKQESISLIISDIRMPGLDGIGLLQEVKKKECFTEVIMATAVTETVQAIEAMRLGAYDYVIKPFDISTVSVCVRRALERRRLFLENKEYHDRLEEKVREKTSELVEKNVQLRLLLLNTIQSLVHTVEAKDTYTEGHSRRVAEMVDLLARHLHFSHDTVERIRLAGMLHDIGKIGVREACLNKPGRLTAKEYDEIQQHPLISERILSPIEALQHILPDIKHHHERFNGQGYPSGLKGEEIPIGARILSLADSFDAMTSNRPYRRALSLENTLREIKENAGRQFDPQLVAIFFEIQKEFQHIKDKTGEKRSATCATSSKVTFSL